MDEPGCLLRRRWTFLQESTRTDCTSGRRSESMPVNEQLLGRLSTRVFEKRTATGSELFSILTCFHMTTFTLLSIFSPLERINIKIWHTTLSWHANFSLPVAVRVSKTLVLKLPIAQFATTKA